MNVTKRRSRSLRLRLKLMTGGKSVLMAVQDIRVGGRQANASYQYTFSQMT